MYCIEKNLHPPTAVEQSLYCNFYNDQEKNLVVAGGNQLKVFRLVTFQSEITKIVDEESNSDEKEQASSYQVKLECRHTFQLFGEIGSIGHVRLGQSNRDSLLITFLEAKLSIVEYDPMSHDLKTLALHNLEQDQLKGGLARNVYPPIVRYDPEQRCCAVLCFGRSIVLVPFKKHEINNVDMDAVDISLLNTTSTSTSLINAPVTYSANDGGSKNNKPSINLNSQCHVIQPMRSTILPAYCLDLSEQSMAGEHVDNIVDIQFLEGYYEPTLLILYEPLRTWSGRLAVRSDTCSMIALSLNIPQRVHPIIWSTQNLPFDCFQALPVSKPIGGVLILAVNSILYLNQSVPPFAVSLNSFAEQSTSFTMVPQRGVTISLDCAKTCFLSNDKLLLSLKDGQLYVVTLFSDGMRSVRRFHFAKAASSVISSCLTICGTEFLFIGSRLGNSLLLKFTERILEIKPAAVESESHELEKEDPTSNESEMETDNEKATSNQDQQDNDNDIQIIKTENCSQKTVDTANEAMDQLFSESSNAFLFAQTEPIIGESTLMEGQESQLSRKRKFEEEIEFDDEDRELYGDEDPVFVGSIQTDQQEVSGLDEMELGTIQIKKEKDDQMETASEITNTQIDIMIKKEDSPTNKSLIDEEIKTEEASENYQEPNNKENKDNENTMEDEKSELQKILGPSDDVNKAEDEFNYQVSKEDPTPIVDDAEVDLQVEPMDHEAEMQTMLQENNSIEKWMAGNVALMRDSEELEVYGEVDEKGEKLPVTLVFEICDSILNIGPCGRFCMGELSFLSEEFQQHSDPQVELVSTAGHGKNGALCVLQRSIRPQIVTTFVLPNCVDLWTVYATPKTSETIRSTSDDKEGPKEFHSYLILSRSDSTMILETGQEINELDQCGYITAGRTVFAGNLHGSRYVLQVMTNAIRLIEGSRQVQHLPLELGSPIVQATLTDPHCVVITESGLAVHLHLSLDSKSPRLIVCKLALDDSSKVTRVSLYKDESGLFLVSKKRNFKDKDFRSQSNDSAKECHNSQVSAGISNEYGDDLDELLYGDSDVTAIVQAPPEIIIKDVTSSANPEGEHKTVDKSVVPSDCTLLGKCEPSFWLYVTKQNGSLELYSIPDQKLVFRAPDLQLLPKLLIDSPNPSTDSLDPTNQSLREQSASEAQMASQQFLDIKEILAIGLGAKRNRSMLFVLLKDELCVYETFRPEFDSASLNNSHNSRESAEDIGMYESSLYMAENKEQINTDIGHSLKIRFRKIYSWHLQSSSETDTKDEEIDLERKYRQRLRPFNNICGYQGVFLCGSSPRWLVIGDRGELYCHEMSVDGSVENFAEFHNINCPRGFLYFNQREDLRIASLPTHLAYEAFWPVRKLPLRCTAHFVTYHVNSKCYVLVTGQSEQVRRVVKIGGEEKDYEKLDREAGYLPSINERFAVQLLSPVSWQMIPGTKIELDEWEHVTCLKNVSLHTEGTETGYKGYVALGTNYCYGEDVTNKGRIWILDIVEVVPEPGQPLTKNKIKMVYCKEQKGPVSTLSQVRGYLLSAIGQKIYIWQLKEEELSGVAFIDTQIYIHSAVSIKNLILIADVYKSVSLLRYQEETKTLALVSRDLRSFEVFACEFMVDSNLLCFLVSDADRNLIIYSYQPEVRESFGGTRLIRRADFHLGATINTFFRIRCRQPNELEIPSCTSYANRHSTVFATLDGGLGFLLPVSEKIYRRLLMVQNLLNNHMQHVAGLNPRAFRLCKTGNRLLLNANRNILDGDLLHQFSTISVLDRKLIAKKIGTTVSQIKNDLFEIERVTAHF